MITQQPATQSQTQDENSYVDDYQPPVMPPVSTAPITSPTPATPITSPTPATPMMPPASMTQINEPAKVDELMMPNINPAVSAAPMTDSTLPTTSMSSTPTLSASDEVEELQDQNIFYLLGVDDGSDDEKESFLDELQQVIWEDFIENDAKLLISAEEMTKLSEMLSKGDSQQDQEEMAVYLEKLIPDLEEIMLEKALELKEDMVWERVAGMREYFKSKPEILAKIDEAEQLAKKDQWHHAAQVLNSIDE